MFSEEISIRVEGLSKRYEIYSQPADRLKQMVLPKLRRWARRSERAYFNEFWALRDVSFDVHRGETVGIVGRNGSGKSTLLQLICGTLTPTLGTVNVRGRVAALLELGSGFNPEFTGRENVYLNAAILGLSPSEIDSRFNAIAAFADIGEFIEQPVKTYSSGMQVRLAFAVAINVDPEILVVDEALSVGDEAFQRKCFARIDAIRKAGATVLFVSHAAGTVIELCHRAILLDAGELLEQGPPKRVIAHYHKLVYAPPDQHDVIRQGIRCASISSVKEIWPATAAAKAALPVGDDALYEENLKSKSTVRYESRGATIEDPHIETLDGRRVNILSRRQEYVYTYKVRFNSAAAGLRFGMMIKTLTGLELGGAASAPNPSDGLMVERGQVYTVKFHFRAALAPATYFLNAGITAVESDGEIFLDRIVDAAMFKVMPDSARQETGVVDLLSEVHLEVETASVP